MEVKIRRIKPEDAKAVRELVTDIMKAEFPKESKAYNFGDLDNPSEHYGGARDVFLVAEKDGAIIGTVAIKEDGSDVALLRRIFVHKDYRGKGYGTVLLTKAMEFCFDHGYKMTTFRGTASMQTAIQLCLKNGFEQDDISEWGDHQLVVLSRDL